MSIIDKLKKTADDLELKAKVDHLGKAAEKAAHQTKEKAGSLAHDNRTKVTRALDKAGAAIDKRTDGKYADKVAKAKGAVTKGVDKLADQRRPGAS